MARKKAFYNYAVKILRHGFVDPETGFRRGKLADGFEAADGFDLREIDDWTPAQKAKVTRLYNFVDHLAARPYRTFRARRPDNLKAVQEAAQHEQFPKALKVAFIPVSDPVEPIKIRISPRTLEVSVRERGVTRRIVNFADYGIGPAQIARDPAGATRELTEAVPADRYMIQAGKYEIPQTLSPSAVVKKVAQLVSRYGAKNFDRTDSSSSYFGNWMVGLNAYNFEHPEDFRDYRRIKRSVQDELKAERARQRRRFRSKFGGRRRRRRR